MDCPICFENIPTDKEKIECGHQVHMDCLQQQFKPECPLCRKSLHIKVFGKPPECNIEYTENIFEVEVQVQVEVEVQELHFSDYLGDDRNSEGEVEYKECREDYDEENPNGDEWYY